MDSLTQVVLGAAMGELVLGRKIGNKAMLYGAIGGTIPDLDVLSRSFFDPLTANEMHRGVTHSLLFSLACAPLFGAWVKRHSSSFLSVFVLLLAAVFIQGNPTTGRIAGIGIPALIICGLIFWKAKVPESLTARDWSWLFWWSLVTHPLLDCHTTWGTQFFWPFHLKLAYNNIFVADPLYTVPFIICLGVAMFFKRNNPRRLQWTRWGLYISTAYMALTLVFKYKAHRTIAASLVRQEIDYLAVNTRPTPLNAVLWNINVETSSDFLLGYHSLLDSKPEVYFVRIPKNLDLLGKWHSHSKIERLKRLSNNQFVITQYADTLVFNDLRFGQFGEPSETKPFLFAYYLIPDGDNLEVQQTPQPTLDGVEFSATVAELFERIKGN